MNYDLLHELKIEVFKIFVDTFLERLYEINRVLHKTLTQIMIKLKDVKITIRNE